MIWLYQQLRNAPASKMREQDYKLKMSPVFWGLINVDTCGLLHKYFRQLSCNCGHFKTSISHQNVATEQLATGFFNN